MSNDSGLALLLNNRHHGKIFRHDVDLLSGLWTFKHLGPDQKIEEDYYNCYKKSNEKWVGKKRLQTGKRATRVNMMAVMHHNIHNSLFGL